MVKKYTSPEIKFFALNKTEDVIQTSGVEMPISSISGYTDMEEYTKSNFNMFSA